MLARSKKNDVTPSQTTENDATHQSLCWRIYQVLCYLILLAKDFFSITPRDRSTFKADENSTIVSQPERKITQNKIPNTSSLRPKKTIKDTKNNNQCSPTIKVSGSTNHYAFYSRNNDPYHFYTPTYTGIPASARRTNKNF